MIKTRIAPSPTGNFHLWTARSALYNFLYAKQNNGKFLLRIEDTDTARSTKFYEEDIIQWLKWLWMDYDIWPDKEDELWPYYQMQRQEIYNKYINQLLKEKKAYYAWDTSEELDKMREISSKNKKAFVYRATQSDNIHYHMEKPCSDEQIEQFKKEWRKAVIRFKVNDKIIKYNDLIKWEIKFDMSQFADFVILKWDWVPTFYLVNVIDDYLMKISHILRWEDHIPNTPKQILIYEALNMDIPHFWHLPMLLNPNKSKMSKRDTENELVTISKFRQEWFLPQALINFIVLLGWHPNNDKEIFNIDDLLKDFSINRIQVSNAIYDYKRALWFNSSFIKKMSNEDFINETISYLQKYWDQEWQDILSITEMKYWEKLAPYIKVRIQTLWQFRDNAKYFFKSQLPSDDIIYNTKMKVNNKIVSDIIPKIYEILKNIDKSEWTEENLKEKLINFVKENWYKNWQILWPIRSVLTWVQASPWAFEMLFILWKDDSLQRIRKWLEK